MWTRNIFRNSINIHKIHSRKLNLQISDEVKGALARSEPIVALESTIITHGMPHPDNLHTALQVEDVIRENNAIPATIGVLNGQVKIGLSRVEIESLARKDDPERTIKLSRRDLPYALSNKLNGGTTVAATMVLAKLAKIPVFVTGGIGGVHRGAETSYDISADLTELGKTPITVVCAGVKSILDIGKTLEYLETEGVTVATYGEKTEFPAFFTPKSGFHSPYNVRNPQQAAEMILSRDILQHLKAVLIAVPIPNDSEYQSNIQDSINYAIEESKLQQISGKELTPFILKYVNDFSKGLSLDLNKKLIKHNAEVGANISVKLSKLKRKSYVQNQMAELFEPHRKSVKIKKQAVVIGGTNIDYVMNVHEKVTFSGRSLDGDITKLYGGVARNLVECISRLFSDNSTLFISAVGNDENGIGIKKNQSIIDTTGIIVIPDATTATYCAVIDNNGEHLFGIADMNIHQLISEEMVIKFMEEIKDAKIVIADGNISEKTLEFVINKSNELGVPVWFEPTDPRKASKPFKTDTWKHLTYISPNYQELLSMHSQLPVEPTVTLTPDDIIQNSIKICQRLINNIPFILVTVGSQGALLCCRKSYTSGIRHPSRSASADDDEMIVKHFPALSIPENSVKSVSGAGDCLAGTVIAGLLKGLDVDLAINAGILAAGKSINSKFAVPNSIDDKLYLEAETYVR